MRRRDEDERIARDPEAEAKAEALQDRLNRGAAASTDLPEDVARELFRVEWLLNTGLQTALILGVEPAVIDRIAEAYGPRGVGVLECLRDDIEVAGPGVIDVWVSDCKSGENDSLEDALAARFYSSRKLKGKLH